MRVMTSIASHATAFVAILAASEICLAQIYPAKPIRVIVPVTAGSGMDTVGRIAVEKMGQDATLPGAMLHHWRARAFVAEKLPGLRKYRVPIIANVFGYAAEDYVEVVRVLDEAEGLAAYELNVSCPNTKHGGLAFGADEKALSGLVAEIRATTKRPLIVKLSPNVAAIEPFARLDP